MKFSLTMRSGLKAFAGFIIGMVLWTAGCADVASPHSLWFEAESLLNGTVASEGAGQSLALECDPPAGEDTCRWTVRIRMVSAVPTSRWALDLFGDASLQDLLSIEDFVYSAPAFSDTNNGVMTGTAPDLLSEAVASNDDELGVPSGSFTLAEFTLVYKPDTNGISEQRIMARFGDEGWDTPIGIAPIVQVGPNTLVSAILTSELRRPVIVINPADEPEICDDNRDNDQDGHVDCDDDDCDDDSSCDLVEVCNDDRDNDDDNLVDCDDPDCDDSAFCAVANAPTLTCPADLVVECDGSGNDAELADWLADTEVESECSGLLLEDDYNALSNECGATGSTLVTWTVTDTCGSDACKSRFEIVDTTVPDIEGPDDLEFVCDESGTQSEFVDWLDSAESTDICGSTAITSEAVDATGDCTATVVWTAEDDCGLTNTHGAVVTVTGDTQPPTLELLGPDMMTQECGVDEYIEPGADVADLCDATIAVDIDGTVDWHQVGLYELSYSATDLCGHSSETLTRTVDVVDTLPPEVIILPAPELWPPNHDYHTFTIADCAQLVDACEDELHINDYAVILSAYSDEPENSNGDGNTMDDIVLVNDHTLRLRAERRGGSNGRVYGVTFLVTDMLGHQTEETCTFVVPHDQSGRPAIDDGPEAGYSIP